MVPILYYPVHQDKRVTLAIISYLRGAGDISAYAVKFMKKASGPNSL